MIELLITSAIISLIIFFLWACMYEGMIFGIVRSLPIPEILRKPLFECPTCMAPWYGTLILLIMTVIYDMNFIEYALCPFISGGINIIVTPFIFNAYDIE